MTDRYNGFLKDLEAFEKEKELHGELATVIDMIDSLDEEYGLLEEELRMVGVQIEREELWREALEKYIKDKGVSS